MRRFFQHYLNPLHIYCLMIKLGINKSISLKIARKIEPIIKNLIY